MHMVYITVQKDDHPEMLLAVAGNEHGGEAIQRSLLMTAGAAATASIFIRTLNQLFDLNVEIPDGLKWIVESDRKYQKREIETRMAGLLEK